MGDHWELVTARLSLRRPCPEDIDAIFAIHHDPKACAHNPAEMLGSRAEAEELFRRWDSHWRRYGFGYWVIHPREGPRRVLGFCGLKLMRLRGREVLNLFYRLDPAVWGNGVATEAATAAVAWGANHIGDRPIVARVHPENIVSAAVATRTGLHRTPNLDTACEILFATYWTNRR